MNWATTNLFSAFQERDTLERANVVNYPDGMIGDIALLVNWKG